MPHDFSGQAFLVTGSTRGIGKAIAVSIAEAGGSVAIHGRELEKVQSVCEEIDSKRTKAFAADLSNPEQAIELVKSVFNHFGRLDGLVNNAGSVEPSHFEGSNSTLGGQPRPSIWNPPLSPVKKPTSS